MSPASIVLSFERMKVLSLMRQGFELVPIEVEVSLTPGLPQILFLGLPDAMIRESVLRIKSALRFEGFEFPQARQVLVHLRPNHLKKSSRGLDLAVAMAILWEMGQISKPKSTKTPLIYGELSLKGEVFMPEDLPELIEMPENCELYTGCSLSPLPFSSLRVSRLSELQNPQSYSANLDCLRILRPELPGFQFSKCAGELLAVIAAGEHPTLLAGPPGTGKSTLAEAVPSFLEEPEFKEFQLSATIARSFGQNLSWRPVVQTHHSVTSLAMIGGGNHIYAGEITRAHGGVLIMDEFLEYSPQIQEALREPCETGSICLARKGQAKTLPARFLLLATTNLCLCGQYLPGKESACRCARHRLNAYLSRLSGPFADRFQILSLGGEGAPLKGEKVFSSVEIFQRVQSAIEFRKQSRQQFKPNGRLSEAELEGEISQVPDFLRQDLVHSRRRQLALWRVARTLADLDGTAKIELRHLQRSREWTLECFESLAHREDTKPDLRLVDGRPVGMGRLKRPTGNSAKKTRKLAAATDSF
jgi:magnesium chelatase family protein